MLCVIFRILQTLWCSGNKTSLSVHHWQCAGATGVAEPTGEGLKMGASSAKQYHAAVALLQRFQMTILHGDMIGPPINHATCVKMALTHAKKNEQKRKEQSLVDAAASAHPSPCYNYPDSNWTLSVILTLNFFQCFRSFTLESNSRILS